jgi:hypothetical protein
MVLEVNHWQDPALQGPARRQVPDFFRKSYFFNSQARVHHLEYRRQALARLRTLSDLTEYFFNVEEPGRMLQAPETSIGGWSSVYAALMSCKARTLRVHPFPITRERSYEVSLATEPEPTLAPA